MCRCSWSHDFNVSRPVLWQDEGQRISGGRLWCEYHTLCLTGGGGVLDRMALQWSSIICPLYVYKLRRNSRNTFKCNAPCNNHYSHDLNNRYKVDFSPHLLSLNILNEVSLCQQFVCFSAVDHDTPTGQSPGGIQGIHLHCHFQENTLNANGVFVSILIVFLRCKVSGLG